MGLSIVRQLVTQMGGEVSLHPNEQGGTTVTFTLLASAGKPLSSTDKDNSTLPILISPRRRLSNLVVEDEPVNRQILQAILTKFDHKVTTAKDGSFGPWTSFEKYV